MSRADIILTIADGVFDCVLAAGLLLGLLYLVKWSRRRG